MDMPTDFKPVSKVPTDFVRVEKAPKLQKLDDGVHIDEDTGELYEVVGGKIKKVTLG
jgi:hypothetical protein